MALFGKIRKTAKGLFPRGGGVSDDIQGLVAQARADGATVQEILTVARTGKPFVPKKKKQRARQGIGESILTGPGGVSGAAGLERTLLGGGF